MDMLMPWLRRAVPALLALAGFASPALACGIVYGKDWAFMETTPAGWKSACGKEAMESTAFTAWPSDREPKGTDAMIYVTVNDMAGSTLAQRQADELAEFRASSPDSTITDLTGQPAGAPLPGRLTHIANAPGQRDEYLAYLEGRSGYYYIIVLTAESPAMARRYEADFRQFVRDFVPMERRDGDAPDSPQQADKRAIRRVVESFRTAIINKDKGAFTSLFYSDDPARVTWQFVVDDARLARVQKTKPEARKARYIPGSNYLSFIDSVVAEPAAEEEVFENVQVDTDGDIASVAFDYRYLSAGKETNHGREMWQLVRTEAGWKIIAVIFSVRDPAGAAAP